ncbi:mechanosensitive ion channel family protein [Mesoterricola sediminis]|uniref:Small-conductance mechanosensitive channel n=1 Tax=Mesoterricola sediminis TaxID=2927980 RepID=A0AA48HCL4_9BACT|nr:mechanosensitive ion channel family protein [Mesoterricola sediminis]BDU75813.1 hypothetical protein METESE_07710 [Mesoterricola sediminis]
MAHRADVLLGNSPFAWGLAAFAAGVVLATPYLVRFLARRFHAFWARRTSAAFAEGLAAALEGLRLPLLAGAAAGAGSLFLDLPHRAAHLLAHGAILALLAQGGILGNRAVGHWLGRHLAQRPAHPDTLAMTAPVLGFILRMVLWTFLLLVALDSFSVNLNALLASLGVGGIAVALAVQNILGDIFASLSISLDKPFVLGEFIITGDVLGTVTAIGLKSTQIRSLSGELVVVSNNDLLKSRIRNYSRMSERRVVFTFGVGHETAPADVAWIPGQVRDVILAQDRVRFDRAHFFQFGESALVFEVVYFVLDPDYNLYMDIQQAINVALRQAFLDRGLAFAQPVRRLVPGK